MARNNYDEEVIDEEAERYERIARAVSTWVVLSMMDESKKVIDSGQPMTSVQRNRWMAELRGVLEAYNIDVATLSAESIQKAVDLGGDWASEVLGKYTSWRDFSDITAAVNQNASELARSLQVDPPELFLKVPNAINPARLDNVRVDAAAEELFSLAHDYTMSGMNHQVAAQKIAHRLYEMNGVGILRNGRLYNLEGYVRLQVSGRWVRTVTDFNMSIGARAGLDGVQMTAHPLCAEDHLPYQGRVFSTEEMDEIQASLERPIAQGYNCRHQLIPCHADDESVYSDEELQKMFDDSTELVDVNGKQMTRYQATQWQREQERNIRKYKTRAKIADAAGLSNDAKAFRAKARELTNRYKTTSENLGLRVQMERTRVGVASISSPPPSAVSVPAPAAPSSTPTGALLPRGVYAKTGGRDADEYLYFAEHEKDDDIMDANYYLRQRSGLIRPDNL